MKHLRKWDLPTLDDPVVEHLDKPQDWGCSIFWYCSNCRHIYASAILSSEDCSHKIWRGVGGLCLTCSPNRWAIRGTLECGMIVGWEVPIEVTSYQLDREIDFLCHREHPHNKEPAE